MKIKPCVNSNQMKMQENIYNKNNMVLQLTMIRKVDLQISKKERREEKKAHGLWHNIRGTFGQFWEFLLLVIGAT